MYAVTSVTEPLAKQMELTFPDIKGRLLICCLHLDGHILEPVSSSQYVYGFRGYAKQQITSFLETTSHLFDSGKTYRKPTKVGAKDISQGTWTAEAWGNMNESPTR